MTMTKKTSNNIFVDIWSSFSSMPFWVQVAILAVAGILPNIAVLFYERGFSRLMALVHVPPWSVLILLILTSRSEVSETYETYLLILAAINIISLAFDIPEAVQWIKGKRNTLGLK